MSKMINPGEYRHKIQIVSILDEKDTAGFKKESTEILILKCNSKIKTTKGFTLIQNNSDFEKAYTNFTLRYPKVVISRNMFVKYNGKIYSIEYLNNVDEANIELEMQCKVVVK